MIFSDSKLEVYFGNTSDEIFLDNFSNEENIKNLFSGKKIIELKKKLKAKELLFLRQIHGNNGLVLRNNDTVPELFVHEGDFIITDKIGLAIGVMTADCLPIIAYDARKLVIGIAHAGWRGLQLGVVFSMIDAMQKTFNSCLENLKIYIGSHAKVCCYEVDQHFMNNFLNDSFALTSFIRDKNKIYFNLARYNYSKLIGIGISPEAITDRFSNCTICNLSYWSYRRQGERAGRQMTISLLKP